MFHESGFQGVLEQCAFKNKKDGNVTQLKITHKDMSGSHLFLLHVVQDFRGAFEANVDAFVYKNLMIPVDIDIDGEIKFHATVSSVAVKKANKKGVEFYAYTIILEKEVGADNEDAILAHYVKKFEHDENGKKQIIPLNFTFTK